jgi:hypothetical protein
MRMAMITITIITTIMITAVIMRMAVGGRPNNLSRAVLS